MAQLKAERDAVEADRNRLHALYVGDGWGYEAGAKAMQHRAAAACDGVEGVGLSDGAAYCAALIRELPLEVDARAGALEIAGDVQPCCGERADFCRCGR